MYRLHTAMMAWLMPQQTLRPATGKAATSMSTPRWACLRMPITAPTKVIQTKA